MAELFVAISQPRNQTRGTYHWALYLQISSTEHAIFQIVENIRIAEIDHVDHFRQVVKDQKIENEMYNWGCQQWVLDVLEALVEADLLTDYDHDEAKLKLVPLFGAQIEDRYEV
ncbi:hypothetical protein I7I51_03980 [Histoplasma capsulatum]|uniref:Uncharacterized protein n=1 Tax=Ajellomyces capsulatus TaxID=5037 RepID=A0A8A1MAR2_AJECA|nr:predicted protein [Histoplasma mississippiense (nom. inval.)]EDN08071.1 predicted protein [Histoplasma mississippiense (nom. inval.)]QSS61803.1 hypothetical protein I7I51_03980 [Histoplasma capsulatum]